MFSAGNPLLLLLLWFCGYVAFMTIVYGLWRWRNPSAGRYREILGDSVRREQYDAQEFRERAIIIDNLRNINKNTRK